MTVPEIVHSENSSKAKEAGRECATPTLAMMPAGKLNKLYKTVSSIMFIYSLVDPSLLTT